MNTVTITGPGIDGNAIQVNPYFGDDGHKGEGVSAVSDPPGNWWHREPPTAEEVARAEAIARGIAENGR